MNILDQNIDDKKFAGTILGRLPVHPKGGYAETSKKVNRYLKFQSIRIEKLIAEKQYDKAIRIWFLVLRNSRSYQTVVFNKVLKGWYVNLPDTKVLWYYKAWIQKCRRANLKMEITRMYIEKKNGKLRPIGNPSITTKMLSWVYNQMLQEVIVDPKSETQHAYRRGRGIYTAVLRILNHWKDGAMYELDFKSFFNTVWTYKIWELVRMKSPMLGDALEISHLSTKYNFKEIKEEAEIKLKEIEQGTIMERYGITQGLPHSPILATLLLEDEFKPWGLTMFADDGIMREEVMSMKTWETRLRWSTGVTFEETKTKKIENEVEFLGIRFNESERTLEYKGSKIDWDAEDWEIKKWCNNVYVEYKKAEKPWKWNPVWNSVINKCDWKAPHLTIGEGPLWRPIKYTVTKGLFYCNMLRQGISIIGGSSFACNWLMKQKIESKRTKMKPLKVIREDVMKKGKYYEDTWADTARVLNWDEKYKGQRLKSWKRLISFQTPKYVDFFADKLKTH